MPESLFQATMETALNGTDEMVSNCKNAYKKSAWECFNDVPHFIYITKIWGNPTDMYLYISSILPHWKQFLCINMPRVLYVKGAWLNIRTSESLLKHSLLASYKFYLQTRATAPSKMDE